MGKKVKEDKKPPPDDVVSRMLHRAAASIRVLGYSRI